MGPPSVSAVSLARVFSLALVSVPLAMACSDGATSNGDADTGGSPSGVAGTLAVAGSLSGAGTTSVAGTTGAGTGGTSAAAGATAAAGAFTAAGASNAGGGGISAAGMGGASAGAPSTGGNAGSNGTAGSAGMAGAGGGGSGADCNGVTGQPVVTVGPSGANFTTVQAALNSLSKTNTTPTQIRIAPGTYKEKLTIAVPKITLCGQTGKASSTILTYSDNANTPNGNGGTLGTTGGASTNLTANDVSVENITFANSTPLGGSQAVALLVSGNQVQFRNCRFLSFQDTLYVRKARQYFRDCYVEGTVDFIFGDGTTVFDNCTVKNVGGGTAATAPNTDQAVPYGLVFLGGQLTADASVKAGSVALGRNWGAYGAAAFLNTALGAHISAAGWSPMGTNTLDTARFSEYKTTGAGAKPASRAPQSKQLTDQQAASYTLTTIFGGWVPSFSK
jgi:pectin methylesterase-like acyl-CoA thioesterase